MYDPIFTHLQELYLHYNTFFSVPKNIGRVYFHETPVITATIKGLKQLRILDMSHNFITEITPDDLPSDEHSSLIKINFFHKSLQTLPNIVYSGKYLTHADFS